VSKGGKTYSQLDHRWQIANYKRPSEEEEKQISNKLQGLKEGNLKTGALKIQTRNLFENWNLVFIIRNFGFPLQVVFNIYLCCLRCRPVGNQDGNDQDGETCA
jgi:hypothetical protein